MTQIHIDHATTRRVVGWMIAPPGKSNPVLVEVVSNGRRIAVPLIAREDVAKAHALRDAKVGFDIVVPDLFDLWSTDYSLAVDGAETYSYMQNLRELDRAASMLPDEGGDTKGQNMQMDASALSQGRQVIFIGDGSSRFDSRLRLIDSTPFRHLAPKKIAGTTFSHVTIGKLGAFKQAVLANIDNVILVLPAHQYERVNAISPTLVQHGRFITVFPEGKLVHPAGIHEFQLNGFIHRKGLLFEFSDNYLASIFAVRNSIEYFAEAIFSTKAHLYFAAGGAQIKDPVIAEFVRDHVQGTRSEDVIRIRHQSAQLIIVNFSAYTRIADALKAPDVWFTAVKRGLHTVTVDLE